MYRVEIRKSAIKELSKLSQKEGLKLIGKIKNLEENPRPHGSIKLSGNKDEYRIRVGNYRVLYTIMDTVLLVEVIKIRDRKNAY